MTSASGRHQSVTVAPRHPLRRFRAKLVGMSLQFREVVEGIHTIQLASVNQAHIQIADLGTIQCFVEERIFPMQNGFLQSPLDQVVVQWGAGNGDIVLLLVKILKTLAGYYSELATAGHFYLYRQRSALQRLGRLGT